MLKEDIRSASAAANLTPQLPEIEQLIHLAIQLTRTITDEAQIPIGASKFGGRPDLPAGIVWPTWQDIPQSFLGQISLPQASEFDADKLLPATGMLWFFYDSSQQTFGDKPADNGAWSVVYDADHTKTLQRTSFPADLPENSRFKTAIVSFTSTATLSDNPKVDLPTLNWSQDVLSRYEGVQSRVTGSSVPRHQLLGHPVTIQDEMRQQCVIIADGIPQGDPQVASRANGWQLLLQLDSDTDIGMRWASAGMLYFWIPTAALQQHQFNTTWLVLQSD